MTPSLFISYSRREAPFVDSLLDMLEDRGFHVWLDYHSLVPARPWAVQIEEGIAQADVVLLVVSKEAMTSKYVAQEWQRALELQKRIILIIFEAVPLPDVLLKCEWIDLRGSFKDGVNQLITLINHPTTALEFPPQTGFRAPRMVWIATFLATGVSLLSLPIFWSLYVPFYLIPLPYRILKRDFNYFRVELALLLFPITMFFAAVFFGDYAEIMIVLFVLSLILTPILFFVLRANSVQRWGKPIATRQRFANPMIPKDTHPQPTRFFIDYAPEDKKYADEMAKIFKTHGHEASDTPENCRSTFVLISRYKHTTMLDPETNNVFPVILQFNSEIDPKLQRVQWIDFRRGLNHLDKLALLLCEPEKILKALCISPPGETIVVPFVVRVLIYFFVITGIFSVGGWLAVLAQTWGELSQSERIFEFFMWFIFIVGGIGILAFASINALIHRKGRNISLVGLSLTLFLLGILSILQFAFVGGAMDLIPGMDIATDTRTVGGVFGTLAYFLGLPLVGILSMIFWKDLFRWLPHKIKQVKSIR